MPTITQIRTALSEGGVSELLRRTGRWGVRTARRTPSTTPPAPPTQRTPSPERSSASNVGHAEALAWFDRRRETYDRLADAVSEYVDPDGTFFDVGANIGYFTLVLAQRTGFRGVAHLFEPVPNLAELCSTTLADATFKVQVHGYGLGDADATLDLHIGADGNLGWNTLVAEKASADMTTVSIQVRDFASTGITDVPSFVKIDVEGAEHHVLRGLLPALRRWPVRPVILCEIGWGTSHPAWDEELAVIADLLALGYRCTDLAGEPIEVATLTRTTDVLFVPA